MLLSSLPYLFAAVSTPSGHVYTWMLHNIDDSAVYLSWMKQVAQGQFFQENRFCIEPQKSVLFNIWFLVLGLLSKVTGGPLAYHLGRLVGVGGLVFAIARLGQSIFKDAKHQRLAIVFTCLASGFGYLFGGFSTARGFTGQPIDLFQPEISVFQVSVYSPLFAPALALIVVAVTSWIRAESSHSTKDAIVAGIATALLGNIHSYDVLHVMLAVICIRVTSDVIQKRFHVHAWLLAIGAGVIALPTTAWVFYATRVDPLFAARADTDTRTVAIHWVLIGFGVALPLAIVAVVNAIKARDLPKLYLAAWFVGALLSSQLPFAFQRKMLMGAQIPLAMLAVAGLLHVAKKLSGDFPKILIGTAVLLALPTNVFWVQDAMSKLPANAGSTQMRPYLTTSENDALKWLGRNGKATDAVLVAPDPTSHLRFPGVALMPHLSVYVPAIAGLTVFDGHWSETINYGAKITSTVRFFDASTSDDVRREILLQNRIRYVLYLNKLADGPLADATGTALLKADGSPQYIPVRWSNGTLASQMASPAYPVNPLGMKRVFSSRDVEIFEVVN
ncbi:MAG: hypothetical protein ACOYLC_05485 [Armatimonadaceae bacterium]